MTRWSTSHIQTEPKWAAVLPATGPAAVGAAVGEGGTYALNIVL